MQAKKIVIWQCQLQKMIIIFKQRKYNAQIVYPIISNGDTIGTVILMSKDSNAKMNEVEKKVAQSAATFLASQMEI